MLSSCCTERDSNNLTRILFFFLYRRPKGCRKGENYPQNWESGLTYISCQIDLERYSLKSATNLMVYLAKNHLQVFFFFLQFRTSVTQRYMSASSVNRKKTTPSYQRAGIQVYSLPFMASENLNLEGNSGA